MGLAVFHDSCDTYIEYRHELVPHVPDFVLNFLRTDIAGVRSIPASTHIQHFVNAVKEAMTADRHPTRPIPVIFQNPFAQRSAIKFKALLKADESTGRSV